MNDAELLAKVERVKKRLRARVQETVFHNSELYRREGIEAALDILREEFPDAKD